MLSRFHFICSIFVKPSGMEPEPQPEAHSLGPPPNQAAPKLSQIKTLAALSEATGETEADLLAYSDTDLEAVFTELQLSTVGKNKIRREVASLRQLVQQSEPPLAQPGLADAKPESPAQPAPQPKPCADQEMMTALAEWKASTPNWEAATELDLGDNQITDVAPLASLTALTELDLGNNQITDVAPLASLTALTELDLGDNQITDVAPLASLTALTDLGLGANQITDVAPLASLTALTELVLGGNQITDVAPLASLTALTDLNLAYNQITDVAPLASLTALTGLYLGGNQITDRTPLSHLSATIYW
eukprot:COSAG03_NODE_494_length_7432_cov_9.546707_2_plen_306_part_00